MKTLMFGKLPDIIKNFRDGGINLGEQLSRASAEDQRALASQSIESKWSPINAKKTAVGRVSDFLHFPEDLSPQEDSHFQEDFHFQEYFHDEEFQSQED
jgi:hypothetical protein